MKKYFPILTFLLVFFMFLGGQVSYDLAYSKKGNLNDESYLHYQKLFDEYSFKTTTGQRIELGKIKAPIVILNFWASWCLPCIEELPSLVALRKTFSEQEIYIIGLNSDQENQSFKIKRVTRQLNLNFPQVADSTGEILANFNVEALPLTLFFYRGKILKVNYGAIDFMSKAILSKLEGILEND
ncbi:MAG: hypothetical protein CME68_08370 [Halobacteriovoraceae bacterium]|nr:hypothetical protein [Halobacteriovoraceae bacterium]